MDERIEQLIRKIKILENEVLHELEKKQREFLYRIEQRKIRFENGVQLRHKKLAKTIRRYFSEAKLLNIATVPVIWAGMVPALLLDLFASCFQAICFPVYGIPKVNRASYIIMDRQALSYLNLIEKINCIYCGYFNGLIAYVQEIAARTEQYWCPIKHAHRLKTMHSRYKYFFDYGDAENYRKNLGEVRSSFDDILTNVSPEG